MLYFAEKKSHEQALEEYYTTKSQLEEDYKKIKNSQNELLAQFIDFNLISIDNQNITIEITNNTTMPVRHLEFEIFLTNLFGEQLGFNRKGVGSFKYNSVTPSDIIPAKQTFEVYFPSHGINNFFEYYNSHGGNMKGIFSITSITLDNNESYKLIHPSNFDYVGPIENMQGFISDEKKVLKKIESYL